MAFVRYVGPVSVEIHDEVLFLPGGAINNWAQKVRSAQTRNTRNAAPLNRRTNKNRGQPPVGTLKAGISSRVTMDATKIVGITTTSSAPYSMFVIGGTRTQWHRGAGGRFAGGFSLPYNAGFTRNANAGIKNFDPTRGTGRTIVQKVAGQPANNFMREGLRRTGMTHPALRGAGSVMMQFR